MQRHTLKKLESKAPKIKKKKNWKTRIFFLVFVILFSGFVYVSNIPNLQIKNISIKGSAIVDQSVFQDTISKEIGGKYFFLIPKTFIYLYPKMQIREDIVSFPAVEGVNISVDRASNTLTAEIIERKQKYLWCAGEDSGSSCYYMDDSGFVFAGAPEIEGSVFEVFYGLLSDNPIGNSFLPEGKMKDLTAFLSHIESLGIKPKTVNVKSISEVHILLSTGGDIIISLESSLSDTEKNLSILASSQDFQSASGGFAKIQYIDMRYGAKAFWK